MASSSKNAGKSNNYVTTIREGAIAANIFRGVTPDGHAYLYYSLSRSWKSPTGNREGYSDRFYVRNGDALQKVVTKACQWIEKNPNAADMPAVPEQVPTAA
ncbi:hypothetical protein [Botrimarina sp.]|uniref:hypothetical protein n=1 Tax=Botrimarina sp. TaxID=2795802 RepID=UPI0032EFDDAF